MNKVKICGVLLTLQVSVCVQSYLWSEPTVSA